MKTCFKCNKEKDRSEFYGHSRMADGLLGKCKECTKADTARRAAVKMANPIWRAEERARHRDKSKRARKLGKTSISVGGQARWAARNREKRSAQNAVARAIRAGELMRLPCEVCGDPNSHGHHHDYSKPLDVWWLCPVHHGQAHWKDNPLVIIRNQDVSDSNSEKTIP